MRRALKTMILERRRGFTAIELMVVLALMAIFLALALPSFEGTVKRYRVNAAASEIANMLQFARAEAIRTRNNVIVNKTSTPGAGCTDSGQDTDWRCGIDVFDDINNSGTQDITSDSATNEPTLKSIPSTDLKELNIQLLPGGTDNTIVYIPLGSVQGGADSMIYIWPASDGGSPASASYANTVCINGGGKVNVIPSFVANTTDSECS